MEENGKDVGRMNQVSKQKYIRLGWHLLLLFVGITMVVPLFFMLRTALASPEHVMGSSASLFETIFPQEWRWENFSKVWKVIPFWRYYANSLFIEWRLSMRLHCRLPSSMPIIINKFQRPY